MDGPKVNFKLYNEVFQYSKRSHFINELIVGVATYVLLYMKV